VKLVDFLHGKWLGHPLHSAIVHIPVGAWIAACGLDVANWLGWNGPAPARLAFYCVAAGLLVAFAAVPTGIVDWLPIKPGKPARRLGWYHMALNAAAIVTWAVNLTWRIHQDGEVTLRILTSSIVGALLVFISGYIGSLMVFDQGTAVARESKHEWKEIARRAGSRVPEEK